MNFDPSHYLLIMGVPLVVFANLLIITNLFTRPSHKYIISVLLVFFISILFGIRGQDVGLDTVNYYNFFNNDYDEISDVAFHLLRFVTFSNPDLALIVVSLITNLVLLHAYKLHTSNYSILMAMSFSMFTFINVNINVIRQGLAISIFFIAASYLFKYKRYLNYFLLAILGSSVHLTAIIPFFAVWLLFQFRCRKLQSLIAILAIAIIFYFIDFGWLFSILSNNFTVFQRLDDYYTWAQTKPWVFKHIYFLICMLWLISFVNNYKSLVSNSATDLSFLSYGALPLGLAIAFVFKTEEMVADRSFYYFIFFIPIILLDLISVMPVSTFVRYIAVIIGINAWFIKTLYLQYPGWFIPPFQSIRM